jgi:hypothetical protein
MLEEEMGDLEIYYVVGWGWPLCSYSLLTSVCCGRMWESERGC